MTGEKQQYKKVWYESTKAAATFGYLEDYPERYHRLETVPRWLVFNGKINEKVTGQISNAERKFAQFSGYIGPQIKKASAEALKKTLLVQTWPIRQIKADWDTKIKKFIEKIDGELQPTSIGGIASKGWWLESTKEL